MENQTRTVKTVACEIQHNVTVVTMTLQLTLPQIKADNVTLIPKGSSIISPITTLMVEADLMRIQSVKFWVFLGVLIQLNYFADNVDNADAIFVEIISHQIMTVTAVATALRALVLPQTQPIPLHLRPLLKL